MTIIRDEWQSAHATCARSDVISMTRIARVTDFSKRSRNDRFGRSKVKIMSKTLRFFHFDSSDEPRSAMNARNVSKK